MACITCGHTMNCIQTGNNTRPGIFMCPRCGTTRKDYGSVHEDHERYVDYIPRLAANAASSRWLDVVKDFVHLHTQGCIDGEGTGRVQRDANSDSGPATVPSEGRTVQ